MGRSYTVQELIDRVRRRADAQHDTQWITDDEVMDYLEEEFARLWNLLLQTGLSYKERTEEITTLADTTDYALQSDFLGVLGVDYRLSGSGNSAVWYELPQAMVSERNLHNYNTHGYARAWRIVGVVDGAGAVVDTLRLYPVPTAGQVYRVKYVPAAPKLTSTSQNVEGINGFEELVVVGAAIKCLQKEESPTHDMKQTYMDLRAEIEAAAELRSIGQPQRIVDTAESSLFYRDRRWDVVE